MKCRIDNPPTEWQRCRRRTTSECTERLTCAKPQPIFSTFVRIAAYLRFNESAFYWTLKVIRIKDAAFSMIIEQDAKSSPSHSTETIEKPLTETQKKTASRRQISYMQKRTRVTAKKGQSNPAFVRLMRSALNSKANEILGWKD